MKKKILIFGNGDDANVVTSELEKFKDNKIVARLKNDKEILSYKNRHNSIHGIIAVGSNYLREKIYKLVKKNYPNIKWLKLISKNAIISKNVKVGEGSIIMSGVIINTGAIIGDSCSINTGSIIEHDNKFQNFSSCGPGVITGGNVIVGKRSYLGIGSTIKDKIKIGYDTVIGAQSYVNKNCGNNLVFF